ncbi:MAG: T9SS type A sorting domain-containing protein, partial [Fibrobacteres bacterium]|nr:T9SS type A sorting domain-containing protein [Fibrobacterota bacterium]
NIVVPRNINLANAQVRICNVAGREVAVFKNLSSYSIQWNASLLPTGSYLVSLTDGTKHFTKKVSLMK